MEYVYEILMLVLGLLVGYFIWGGRTPSIVIFSNNILAQMLFLLIVAVLVIWLVGLLGIVAFIVGLMIGHYMIGKSGSRKKDWRMR